jgi:hypothetical protein
MRAVNATKFHRKFGGAKPRDLQFRGPFFETWFLDRSVAISAQETKRVKGRYVRASERV